MMETNAQRPQKRTRGMTVLLVLSSINACWNILSSFVMYVATPIMAKSLQNGQFEEMMAPYSAMFSEEQQQMMMEGTQMMAQIDTKYYLFLILLFIGSLFGVVRMFKNDKRGFHIYCISQILILINASVFLYPHQPQSGFVSDLLMTAIFILLYYMYFKRIAMNENQTQTPDDL